MRKFATAAALVVLSLTGATAASAQMHPGWHRGDAPPPPPSHWHRAQDRWERHVSACLDRYRSYDPRTDTYNAGRGHMRRCKL